MIEQNAGGGAVDVEGLKVGAQAEGERGVVIGNAEDLKAVDDHHLIGQDADAGLFEG